MMKELTELAGKLQGRRVAVRSTKKLLDFLIALPRGPLGV